MEKFVYLEVSGYLAIALIAFKLLLEIINLTFEISESMEIMAIASIFAFGFSKQVKEEESLIESEI